jgi:hypothetical protein
MNTIDYKKYHKDCEHMQYVPLGFEKIYMDDKKVECITAILCKTCGLIRSKILYYDRLKGKNDNV